MGILILILPLIVLWFFLIRPQQQRNRERAAMVARLKVGDEVVTAGGILGIVTELDVDGDSDVLLLEVAQGVEIAVLRRGIGEVRFVGDEDDDLGAGLLTGDDEVVEALEAPDDPDDTGDPDEAEADEAASDDLADAGEAAGDEDDDDDGDRR